MIDQLTAGDTLAFDTAGGDYPASAGWSLVYKLIPRTAGTVITITSSASGDDHAIQVAPAVTAAWPAGVYSWVCYATKSGERQTLQQGITTVLADPGVATTLDNRTPARKALDAADAALEAYGSKAYTQQYEIAGRSMRFHTPADFLAWRSKLQIEVQRELRAANLAAGRPDTNKIHVRVPRA